MRITSSDMHMHDMMTIVNFLKYHGSDRVKTIFGIIPVHVTVVKNVRGMCNIRALNVQAKIYFVINVFNTQSS